MSMSIRLEYTWYDAYQDPDILAAIQAVLNAHQLPGVQLDWQVLLTAESEGDTESFPDTEGPYIAEAVFILVPHAKARRGVPLDLVPVTFDAPVLDLASIKRPRWCLYPAERVIDQWMQHSASYVAEQEELAQKYQQADQRGDWPRTNEDRETVIAYAQLAIVRLARGVIKYQVPGRLFT